MLEIVNERDEGECCCAPLLGWAIRDWLRCGIRNFTPMSGFVQLLKLNSQNRHENEHQSSACAQQFSAHKTHSDAIRKQRPFDREAQSWTKFKRVGPRLAKSRFGKHVHACSVASHVVSRARDACCPQSLT